MNRVLAAAGVGLVRDRAGAARGTNWAWIRVGWPWQIFAPQQLFLSPTLSPSTNVSRSKPLLPKQSGIEGNCAVLQNVALIEEEGEGKEEGRGRFWRFLLPLLFLFLAVALNVSRSVRPSVAVTDGFVEADTVHSRQFPRSAAVPSGSGRVSGTNAFRSQFSLPSPLLE